MNWRISGARRWDQTWISSVSFLAWVKQMVLRPFRMARAKSWAAVTGAPPGGLRNRKCRPDWGAPLSVMISTSSPVSDRMKISGWAMVAEDRINCGFEP